MKLKYFKRIKLFNYEINGLNKFTFLFFYVTDKKCSYTFNRLPKIFVIVNLQKIVDIRKFTFFVSRKEIIVRNSSSEFLIIIQILHYK